MDEEFGDPAEECSELPSSVHDPEQRTEPADNNHRGMKYYIHMISGQVSSSEAKKRLHI